MTRSNNIILFLSILLLTSNSLCFKAFAQSSPQLSSLSAANLTNIQWELLISGPNSLEIKTQAPAWLADAAQLKMAVDLSNIPRSVESLSLIGNGWSGTILQDPQKPEFWRLNLQRTLISSPSIRLLAQFSSGNNLNSLLTNNGGIVIVEVVEGYFVNPSTNDVLFWPNPCLDHLHLAAPENCQQVQILNPEGVVKLAQTEGPFGSLSLAGIPPGLYYLKVLKNDGSYAMRSFIHQ